MTGRFYRLRSAGFDPWQALLLAREGFDVIGWAVVVP